MCVLCFAPDDEYDDDVSGAGVCCQLSVEQSVPHLRMIGVSSMSLGNRTLCPREQMINVSFLVQNCTGLYTEGTLTG